MKNLRPFVLAEALAGAPVCDAHGNPVYSLSLFLKVSDHRKLVGVHEGDLTSWSEDGTFLYDGKSSPMDLRMAEPLEISDEMCEKLCRTAFTEHAKSFNGVDIDREAWAVSTQHICVARHALKLLAAHGMDVAGVCG